MIGKAMKVGLVSRDVNWMELKDWIRWYSGLLLYRLFLQLKSDELDPVSEVGFRYIVNKHNLNGEKYTQVWIFNL